MHESVAGLASYLQRITHANICIYLYKITHRLCIAVGIGHSYDKHGWLLMGNVHSSVLYCVQWKMFVERSQEWWKYFHFISGRVKRGQEMLQARLNLTYTSTTAQCQNHGSYNKLIFNYSLNSAHLISKCINIYYSIRKALAAQIF